MYRQPPGSLSGQNPQGDTRDPAPGLKLCHVAVLWSLSSRGIQPGDETGTAQPNGPAGPGFRLEAPPSAQPPPSRQSHPHTSTQARLQALHPVLLFLHGGQRMFPEVKGCAGQWLSFQRGTGCLQGLSPHPASLHIGDCLTR